MNVKISKLIIAGRPPKAPLSDIELQTAYWLVKTGEADLSADQRAAFQVWLSQSPEHWKTYNEMKRDSADVPT